MSVVPDISPSFKDGRSGGSRETIRISIMFPRTMSDHEIEGLEVWFWRHTLLLLKLIALPLSLSQLHHQLQV